MSIAMELGAFKDGRGTLQLAYRSANDGEDIYGKDNAVTAGITYLPWDNVQLSLFETWYSGGAHSSVQGNLDASGTGDRLTSVNLAVGF